MGVKNTNVKFTLKRKLPPEKVKTKKLKSNNDSAKNNGNNSNGIVKQNGFKPKPSEIISDTRKRLPVYIVKSRY